MNVASVANGRMSQVVGMAAVALVDVDYFVVMTVVRDYYDYLDD